MTLESILRSIREILAYIPGPHWVGIGVLTLAVVLFALRRGAARRSSGPQRESGPTSVPTSAPRSNSTPHGRKPQAASPGQHVSEVTPRRTSFYGAVALGIAVFAGLLFIETTVVIRWCGIVTNGWGVHLNLDFKRILFLHSQGYESLFNIVAFVPFGFFLAEYLYVTTHRPKAAGSGGSAASTVSATSAASDVSGVSADSGVLTAAIASTVSAASDVSIASTATGSAGCSTRWRIFLLSILITFCLSLCIECLQLTLHVGFFELTDLAMNTLGGLLGASLSLLLRAVFSPSK